MLWFTGLLWSRRSSELWPFFSQWDHLESWLYFINESMLNQAQLINICLALSLQIVCVETDAYEHKYVFVVLSRFLPDRQCQVTSTCYVSFPVPVSKPTLQNLPSIMYKEGTDFACIVSTRTWSLTSGACTWLILNDNGLSPFWWIIKFKLFCKQNIFVNTMKSGVKAGALSIFNFHCRQQYSLWPVSGA